MIKVDYRDNNGVMRRVQLMNEHEPPEKGIPVDCYTLLDEFYHDTSERFRKALYNQLWAMGLIEKHHFLQPDSKKKFRQALQSTLARDSTDAIRYLTEQE